MLWNQEITNMLAIPTIEPNLDYVLPGAISYLQIYIQYFN